MLFTVQYQRRLKRELSNALLVLIAIFPTHLLFQIYANPPEVEFQGNIFKLRKRSDPETPGE